MYTVLLAEDEPLVRMGIKSMVDWETLGYPTRMTATVTDLWSGAVVRGVRAAYAAEAPPHGVVMIRVES